MDSFLQRQILSVKLNVNRFIESSQVMGGDISKNILK